MNFVLRTGRNGNNTTMGSQNVLRKKRVQFRLIKWRGKPWRELPCLKCGLPFMSFGPGNRLCDLCREGNMKIDWGYVRWIA